MDKLIYQKTSLGTVEINHRSNVISGRLRRLLIMIDGRKDVGQLRLMAPPDDLPEALSQLEALQLIELLQAAPVEVIRPKAPQVQKSPRGVEEEFWGSV